MWTWGGQVKPALTARVEEKKRKRQEREQSRRCFTTQPCPDHRADGIRQDYTAATPAVGQMGFWNKTKSLTLGAKELRTLLLGLTGGEYEGEVCACVGGWVGERT